MGIPNRLYGMFIAAIAARSHAKVAGDIVAQYRGLLLMSITTIQQQSYLHTCQLKADRPDCGVCGSIIITNLPGCDRAYGAAKDGEQLLSLGGRLLKIFDTCSTWCFQLAGIYQYLPFSCTNAQSATQRSGRGFSKSLKMAVLHQ